MIVNIPAQAGAELTARSATPADLYGFFELLLLHELTHTYAGGRSQDYTSIQPGVGGGAFLAATSVANEWNTAETLAYMALSAN